MRQKAAAYKMYGDAAMTALVLEALPKVQSYFLSVECKRVTSIACVQMPPLPSHQFFLGEGGLYTG